MAEFPPPTDEQSSRRLVATSETSASHGMFINRRALIRRYGPESTVDVIASPNTDLRLLMCPISSLQALMDHPIQVKTAGTGEMQLVDYGDHKQDGTSWQVPNFAKILQVMHILSW
eukprot:SAG11_NODE_537_length_8672_cov_3.282632_4_plen_116_part_00